MKRIVPIFLTFLLLLTASCGRKGVFILNGTVQDGTDSILVMGLDSRFDRFDTIFCKQNRFSWRFSPDTVTTLLFVLPDGRRYPVFAEKGVKSEMIISNRDDIGVSGGYCNDLYLSFYRESLYDTTMEQTFARIDSLIIRDPFSEVTPYLIYEQMIQRYNSDEKTVSKLISKMSGNMQDAPFITALKTEFKGGFSNDSYLDTWAVTDSLNQKFKISDVIGSNDYLVVCVWASWAGDRALQARKELDSIRAKYAGRSLNIADVSIDVNIERWKKIISKDTLSWFSYIDNQGWESQITKSCNLNKLPVFVLFTKSKRAIFCTTSLTDMEKKIDGVLPEKKEKNTNKKK